MTENYYVVFQNPATAASLPHLLGTAPAAASRARQVPGVPTLLHLVPRRCSTSCDASSRPLLQPRTFRAPPLFALRHANAYEADGGRVVVVDSIHPASSTLYDNSLLTAGREVLAEQEGGPDVGSASRLRRVEIDLETDMLVSAETCRWGRTAAVCMKD